MWLDLEMFARMVTSVAVPILLGNATLLALVSSRNQHVSDRARANVIEATYQLPISKLSTDFKERRLNDLKLQNKRFIRRYRVTSASFLFLVATLCCFAATSIFSFRGDDGRYPTLFLAGWCALAASVFGVMGFLLLIYEFCRGTRTLKSNNGGLESMSINDLASIDRP
jgi:hypothetical protein